VGQADDLLDSNTPRQEFYPPPASLFKHGDIGSKKKLRAARQGKAAEGINLQPLLDELVEVGLETVVAAADNHCFRRSLDEGQRAPEH
jgi:hypothetical protein